MKSKLKALAQELGITTLAFSIALVLLLGVTVVKAWTAPGSNPPAGNLGAPLNTSATGQTKQGGLILNTSGAANGLIVQNGKVGIGTVAPADKLDVSGGNIRLTGGGFVQGVGGNLTLNADNTNNIFFDINGGEKMRISGSNGNGTVGIGTMNPDGNSKLDVNGDIFVRPDAGGGALTVFARSSDNFAGAPLVVTNNGASYVGGMNYSPAGVQINVGSGLNPDMTLLPNGHVSVGTASPNASATMTVAAAHPLGGNPWPLYLKGTAGGGDGVYLGSDGSNGLAIARGMDGAQVAHIQSDGSFLTAGMLYANGPITSSGRDFYGVAMSTLATFNNCTEAGLQSGNGMYILMCNSACRTWCAGGYSGIIYSGGVLSDEGAGVGYCSCIP